MNSPINFNTFKGLYEFLQLHEDDNIIKWLQEPCTGWEKQESLLRLFAAFGLIYKLNSFHFCTGNYNLKTIKKITSIKDIFFKSDGTHRMLKDSGDTSDVTMVCKENDKRILVISSKNRGEEKNEGVNKLDVRQIHSLYTSQYDNYEELIHCTCTKNRERLIKKIENSRTKDIKEMLQRKTTIIIDWSDLNEAYHQFKKIYEKKPIKDILNLNKTTLCLRMHQQLGVSKTLRMKNNEVKQILWGHTQRSGKSYIIGGCIIEDSRDKCKCNYLIITTAPKETIDQQKGVFDHIQFNDFKVIVLNGNNKNPVLTEKNIIICSKQFLQSKIQETKEIPWLKKLSFDMRFIDESHNGGTTEIAQNTLKFYGNSSVTVQITATYSKPVNDYNIPKEHWILWDLEDIKLCKNITDENNIIRLVKKHGECIRNIISKYSHENIISEYSKYPELRVLTDKINPDIQKRIIDQTQDNEYGWSTDACFLLQEEVQGENKVKREKFQNEEKNLELWFKIFGKRNEFGIPDKDYPDDNTFIKRYEKICKTEGSRFIGEGAFNNEPMIIMAFLPQNDIDKISRATINLFKKKKVLCNSNYAVININSKTTHNPKKAIEDARDKAKNDGKKGVLVLSGRQCSLGVTINNCDIVLLLNNCISFDLISQMMFRCMTEGKSNKKFGFVFDLNIHRSINFFMDYVMFMKPGSHPREALKYILQEKIINLNADHWMPSFGNHESKLTELCKNVYETYSSHTENNLDRILNNIKQISLTKDEQKIFNAMFSNVSPKKQKKTLNKDDEEKIKKGIEKTKIDTEINEHDAEKKQVNYTDIFKDVMPLICILTIHHEKTSFIEMIEVIENDKHLFDVFVNQIKTWWGKLIDIKIFVDIYIKYMKVDKETTQVIRTVKELFMKNIKNTRKLSILIDKYLIPTERERKENGEVTSPFVLRLPMLDKIPVDFWKTPKKVFEPCSGKGGFILDIIDKFMDGLKESIPDEKLRYKTIVENCLYFSDINPTNIFICKLLIDPCNEYKLNYNEGNTLELNITEKWGIDRFDAVIGNPPFNSSGNTGTGNTLWQNFTKKSLNEFVKEEGYLLYVHPPGWRKPNTERGKFYGLYELMTSRNQMIHLSIHGIKDGHETFNCGTRYDWYLIQRINKYTTTTIVDEKNNIEVVDMAKFNWLPNYGISTIQKYLAKEQEQSCDIIQSYAYDPRKKIMSNTETSEFKYPCIHSTPKKGPVFKYSNTNKKGHFDIKKVIFGDSGINKPIIDINGEYGMTQHAMGIEIQTQEEADELVKALKSDEMKKLIDSCSFSSYQIDWNIFKDMKKHFWKEF